MNHNDKPFIMATQINGTVHKFYLDYIRQIQAELFGGCAILYNGDPNTYTVKENLDQLHAAIETAGGHSVHTLTIVHSQA